MEHYDYGLEALDALKKRVAELRHMLQGRTIEPVAFNSEAEATSVDSYSYGVVEQAAEIDISPHIMKMQL